MKAWLLVIVIFGEPAYESQPMTHEQCTEAKDAIVSYVDRRATIGAAYYFSGRKVSRDDVKVDCLPA